MRLTPCVARLIRYQRFSRVVADNVAVLPTEMAKPVHQTGFATASTRDSSLLPSPRG